MSATQLEPKILSPVSCPEGVNGAGVNGAGGNRLISGLWGSRPHLPSILISRHWFDFGAPLARNAECGRAENSIPDLSGLICSRYSARLSQSSRAAFCSTASGHAAGSQVFLRAGILFAVVLPVHSYDLDFFLRQGFVALYYT